MKEFPLRVPLKGGGNELREVRLEIINFIPTHIRKTGRIWYNTAEGRPQVFVNDSGGCRSVAYTDDAMIPAEHYHPISEVTDLQAALDSKQNTINGAASTIVSVNLTPNMAMISNASGKAAVSSKVTVEELEFLDGVTSGVQAQLNSKMPENWRGAENGVASLVAGKVPASQLPSYMEEVIEVATLPASGVQSTIYVVTTGTHANKTFRWSGSQFVMIGDGGSGAVIPSDSTPNEVFGAGSAGTGTNYARYDHKHALGNGAVTNSKIADYAVTNTKIADNSIQQSQMRVNSVGTEQIIGGNVTNSCLPSKPGYTVMGNPYSGSGEVQDIPIADLLNILIAQNANMPRISRIPNPELSSLNGASTWTIDIDLDAYATRKVASNYVASVQVYELNTDENTTATQVLTATSINKTNGNIEIVIGSSATIAANSYVAVIII